MSGFDDKKFEGVRVQRCIGSTPVLACNEVDRVLASRMQALEIQDPAPRITIGSTQITYCKPHSSPAVRYKWRKQQAASPASYDVSREFEQFTVGGMQFRKIPFTSNPESVKHAKSIFRLYANGPFSWTVFKSAFMNFNKYLYQGGWFSRAEIPEYKQFAYLKAVEESSLPFPRKGKMPDFSKRVYPNWITRLSHYRFLCKVFTFNDEENEFAALMDEYFIWSKKNHKAIRCQAQMFNPLNYVGRKVADAASEEMEAKYPEAAKAAQDPKGVAREVIDEFLQSKPQLKEMVEDPVGGLFSSLGNKMMELIKDVFLNWPKKILQGLGDSLEGFSFSAVFDLLKSCFKNVSDAIGRVFEAFEFHFDLTDKLKKIFPLFIFFICVYMNRQYFVDFLSLLKLGVQKLVLGLGYTVSTTWWTVYDTIFGTSRVEAQGFTLTGGLMAAMGYFVVTTMKPTSMANYSSFVNVVSRSGSLMDNFVEIVTDVVDNIYFWIMDEHLFPNRETMAKFDKFWKDMVAFSQTPMLQEAVLRDRSKTQELQEIVTKGADLYSAMKAFKGPMTGIYLKTYEGLRLLHEEALANADMYKKRIETVCVWLQGEPGQGKTLMLRTLPELLHKMLVKKFPGEYPAWSPSLVFEKVKDSDYWETYCGQPFCTMNEVLNKNDELTRAKELSTVQSICDISPLPLNVAFGMKGKVFFRSEVLICTTNFDNSDFGLSRQNKTGMTCPVSMIRRQAFPFHVVRGETLLPDASNFDKAWIFVVKFPKKVDENSPYWKEAFLGISRFLGISPKSKDFAEGPYHKAFVAQGNMFSFTLSQVARAMFKEICLRKKAGSSETLGSKIPMPIPDEVFGDFEPNWTTIEKLADLGAVDVSTELQTILNTRDISESSSSDSLKAQAQAGEGGSDESSGIESQKNDLKDYTTRSLGLMPHLARYFNRAGYGEFADVVRTSDVESSGEEVITNTICMNDCVDEYHTEKSAEEVVIVSDPEDSSGLGFPKAVTLRMNQDTQIFGTYDPPEERSIRVEDMVSPHVEEEREHWTASYIRSLNYAVPLPSDPYCTEGFKVRNSFTVLIGRACEEFIHNRFVTGRPVHFVDTPATCLESWVQFLCSAPWEDVRSVFRASSSSFLGLMSDSTKFLQFVEPIRSRNPNLVFPGEKSLCGDGFVLQRGNRGTYILISPEDTSYVLPVSLSVFISSVLRAFNMLDDVSTGVDFVGTSGEFLESQLVECERLRDAHGRRTLYSTMVTFLSRKPRVDIPLEEICVRMIKDAKLAYAKLVENHPWFKWVFFGACAVSTIAMLLKPVFNWFMQPATDMTVDEGLWVLAQGGVASKLMPESQSITHRTAYTPAPLRPATQSVTHRTTYIPPDQRAVAHGFDESVGRANKIGSQIRMVSFRYADGTIFKSWTLVSGTSIIMTCHPLRGWGTNFTVMCILGHGDLPEVAIERQFITIRMGDNGEMGGGRRDIAFLDVAGHAFGSPFKSLRQYCPGNFGHKVSKSIMRVMCKRTGKESTLVCQTSDYVTPYNGTDLSADYKGCKNPGTVVSNNFITIHGLEGRAGDCSSPYISIDPDSGVIYLEGIHTAGCGGDSYACPIYQSDFPEIKADSQGFLYPQDVYVSPLIEENMTHGGPFTGVPDGAHPVGTMKKGNFIPSKTCFVPSLFQGNGCTLPPLYEVDQYPAALSPFVNEFGEVVNPLEKAKTKQFAVDKSNPLPSWAAGLFAAHPGAFSEGFFGLRDLIKSRPLRRLTIEEAVFGIPGKLDSIDMTTSEGILLRLKGLKRKDAVRLPLNGAPGFIHPFIYEEIARIEQAVAEGKLPKLVTIFALKDEPRELERVLQGKTRGFHVGDFIHMIWIRMVLGDLIMFLKKHRSQTVGAIGTNPHGQDWKIWRDIFTSRDFKYGGGDYSGYDTGLRCVFSYWMGIDCANFMGYGPGTLLYREVVYACMSASGPILIVSRTVYWLSFANPSGGYLTGFFNTYCNVVIFSLVFFVLQKECRETCCGCGFSEETIKILWRIFYGDDNLWGVPPRYGHHWNMKSLSELIFQLFGMTYTNPDKSSVETEFLEVEDLEFLKRKWRVVSDSLVYATLDESSIHSMLLWIRDTGSLHGNVEQLKVNIGVAGMEMYYYGRPRFESWRNEILEACRVYNVNAKVETYEYHHTRFMNNL